MQPASFESPSRKSSLRRLIRSEDQLLPIRIFIILELHGAPVCRHQPSRAESLLLVHTKSKRSPRYHYSKIEGLKTPLPANKSSNIRKPDRQEALFCPNGESAPFADRLSVHYRRAGMQRGRRGLVVCEKQTVRDRNGQTTAVKNYSLLLVMPDIMPNRPELRTVQGSIHGEEIYRNFPAKGHEVESLKKSDSN